MLAKLITRGRMRLKYAIDECNIRGRGTFINAITHIWKYAINSPKNQMYLRTSPESLSSTNHTITVTENVLHFRYGNQLTRVNHRRIFSFSVFTNKNINAPTRVMPVGRQKKNAFYCVAFRRTRFVRKFMIISWKFYGFCVHTRVSPQQHIKTKYS